jgi:hypothetical protein
LACVNTKRFFANGSVFEVSSTGHCNTARSLSAGVSNPKVCHDGLHRDPGVDAEQVARAMFALLAARLPTAEVEDAKAATPRELHNLWPS